MGGHLPDPAAGHGWTDLSAAVPALAAGARIRVAVRVRHERVTGGKVAAGLGLHAVIDDRAENCMDVIAESQAKPILIWRGFT
jgi:hypothetical protein